MSAPLASSWLKLAWAERYAESLDGEFDRAFDPELHPLGHKSKIERSGPDFEEWVWRFVQIPAIPEHCGLIIGDVLHNYRSALDHLAWQLVRLVGTKPPDPKRVQFPMATSYKSFRHQLRGRGSRLPGVPAKPYIALIRRYQPYRRDEPARAMRLLRDLSDLDKHRVPVPMLVTPLSHEMRIEHPGWLMVEPTHYMTKPRAVREGTKFFSAKLKPDPNWSSHPEPKVDGELRVYPSFGRSIAVKESLTSIAQTVDEILTQFQTLLTDI